MACRHNQVQPDATRIIWIHFPTFWYNYVQLMANRNNYVEPGAKTGLLIPFQMYIVKGKAPHCKNYLLFQDYVTQLISFV